MSDSFVTIFILQHGVVGLTRNLDVFFKEGIRVNAVAPGVVPTTNMGSPVGTSEKWRQGWEPLTPIEVVVQCFERAIDDGQTGYVYEALATGPRPLPPPRFNPKL